MPVDGGRVEIERLPRREVGRMMVAYNFDLHSNEFSRTLVPNPAAGTEHAFKAYRLEDDPVGRIVLRERSRDIAERVLQNRSVPTLR